MKHAVREKQTLIFKSFNSIAQTLRKESLELTDGRVCGRTVGAPDDLLTVKLTHRAETSCKLKIQCWSKFFFFLSALKTNSNSCSGQSNLYESQKQNGPHCAAN